MIPKCTPLAIRLCAPPCARSQSPTTRRTVGLRLVPIGPDHMADRLGRLINFQKFDARNHKWVSIDCPRVIAATYLARVGLSADRARHLSAAAE